MDISELEFEQQSSGWPLSARLGELRLRFSGSFSTARIVTEKAVTKTNQLVDVVLYVVAGVGVAAFAYGLYYYALQESELLFFVQSRFLNIFLWVGVFAALYLWARKIQQAAQYEVTRVLSAANLSHWASRGEELDVYALFTQGARQVWNAVPTYVTTAEPTVVALFLSLLKHPSIRLVFFRFGVNPDVIEKELQEIAAHSSGVASETASVKDEYLYQIPFVAVREGLVLRNRSVDPLMLLCALVKVLPEEHPVQKIFFNRDLSTEKLEVIAGWIFNLDVLLADDQIFRKLARHKSDRGLNKGLTAVPTPYLDQFSVDLTIAAKYHRLPLTRGRDEDTDKIVELLTTSGKSVLVTGAVGTGRSTVLADLAYRMASEQVPTPIQDKRLIRLELAGILGSNINPEQALLNIFREAEHSGNIVFAIDDIQQLAKASGSEGLSLLEVLVNHIENSPIAVIATTTPEDYQTTLRNSANFDERFARYELTDLSFAGIMLASCMRASQLEGATGAFFEYQAIEEAVHLTDEYFKDVGQPQKTILVLEAAAQKVKTLPKGPAKLITPESIQVVVAEKTHVPTASFTQNEAEKLLHLETDIASRVVGQKEAVVAVSEGMRRARSGLSSGQRPLASFLFVGPTGVGKTELAKTLAAVYFGDERYLLRLDMSEYRGDDGMRKLVGAPGQQTSTPFITHLKTYPFCLFLLDELEKASPDVLNLFLAVLEDGRITTAGGQTLDLTHTIIIATSNAGTPEIQAGITEGRPLEQIKSELLEKILTNYYRPEFLNRFDSVILFRPLEIAEVEQITRLQLAQVTKRLLEKKIKLAFSDAAIHKVAVEAFDPLLGGRPVRRYIQDHVESVIAKLLLSKQLDRGGSVTIDVNETGEFVSK